ncbi:hypothetical protein A9Q94_11890 [Rhodobacterales bacterium 56_14_T64]|nr:hypothetical protein A9Q94_11890 [Rhodobacterales bacterium 56_14_T64]
MRDGAQPDGTRFAPRKQSTLDRYTKLGLTFGAPLTVSGDMRDTLFMRPPKATLNTVQTSFRPP